MASLRSYVSRGSEAETAYRRVIGLFLQGISQHAVEGDKLEHQHFRDDINKFASIALQENPMSELMVVVSSALRSMKEYNHQTTKFVRRQNAELQKMVAAVSRTLDDIGSSGAISISSLQNIEKIVEEAEQVDDVPGLKQRLGKCLEAVRDESVRQKAHLHALSNGPKKELEILKGGLGSFKIQPDVDAATGLPGKADADRAIRSAVETPQGKFLLVAVCSRVQAVNARFGYSVGDMILAAFADHFVQGLAPGDQVFRWQGPALVALLERPERLDRVRAEVRQFAEIRLDKTAEVGQRTVLIPISTRWSIFPVTPLLEELLQQVEAFTTAQIPS